MGAKRNRHATKKLYRSKVISQEEENPGDVKFMYGVEVVNAVWEEGTNRVRLGLLKFSNNSSSNEEERQQHYDEATYDFVCGVDGTASAVRDAMGVMHAEQEKQDNDSGGALDDSPYYMKYPPSNSRVYRTLKLNLPEGWRKDVNYAARGDKDRELLFDVLPLEREREMLGVLLSRPGNPQMKDLNVTSSRQLMEDLFPQFSQMASDESLQEFSDKGDSKLPDFAYCNGPLHYRNSTVLLGDAIHTVKPYFGLGVNSALEDILILDDAISACGSMGAALKTYSEVRGPCARALVEMSRSYDRDVRNPINLLSFLVPLLLDNFFNSLAPSVFEKTELGLFQDERISFTEIVQRKKKDRILQVLTITVFLMITGKMFPSIVSLL
eukprot:jgi/Bigna1/128567/aug1.7_g3275